MPQNSQRNRLAVLDELLDVRPLVELTEKLQRLIRSRLWAQILIAMAAGIAIGAVLSPSGYGLLSPAEAAVVAGWFALPGQIFLALIQMVVIPLVVTSIILGICSSGDPTYLRKLGGRIGFFFLAATTAAVSVGIVLALAVSPGNYMDRDLVQRTVGTAATVAAPDADAPALGSVGVAELPQQLVALIPSDPARAALERSMLQLVLFAILIGVALVSIKPQQAKPLLDLMGSIQEVSMEVVSWAMLLAPIAVFGLLAQLTVQIGFQALLGMSVYVGTVLFGLGIVLVLYLIVVWSVSGRTPWSFLADIREVLLLAFSTSSSVISSGRCNTSPMWIQSLRAVSLWGQAMRESAQLFRSSAPLTVLSSWASPFRAGLRTPAAYCLTSPLQRAGSSRSNLRRSPPWPWQTTHDSPPTASMSETMT